MKMTHHGKIGRLPKAVQEQLNRRLEKGERGGPLAAWLNSLPEVQPTRLTEQPVEVRSGMRRTFL
jgi:hypothetical protein